MCTLYSKQCSYKDAQEEASRRPAMIYLAGSMKKDIKQIFCYGSGTFYKGDV